MRTVLDALLSTQKYVAVALGDGWEVRLMQDRGEIIEGQPVAVVMLVGDAIPGGGSARFMEYTQPFVVHCYPVTPATTTAAVIQASRVQEMLEWAFRVHGVGLGFPSRVPLFDYSAVADPLTEDSDVRFEHDFLSILNFSTHQMPDGDDPRRIRVIANFTARWRRTGLIPYGPPLEQIIIETNQVG